MRIGLDIDGVIAPNPWSMYPKKNILGIFFFYFSRRPNQFVKDLIRKYKEEGHRIILISGIGLPAWPVIFFWLKYHRVPFDKLFLRWWGRNGKFKAREIKRNECEMYIEDDPLVFDEIKRELKNLGIRIIQENRWKINQKELYIFTL